MANFPHVPPITPDMIPEGCYAKWNDVTLQWEFPSLETITPKGPTVEDVWNVEP